ncbi:WD repeat protein [Aspergillus campestris IBT 28561]|uniref:WD repeat protein n=1 Tax=Aspergillus campestris (strain IBT 28561) TaxID=1392248 RepID=A0A2I1CY34_ASPC2|nr:WD repeat protein [Aspergillus campestris IBT 28561]PKY02528.1 WD repeat protein [Aspergillus campestris IBT 28561]
MHPSLEHIDACLPVAALKVLNLGGTRLILQGHGSYTRLIEDETGTLLAQLKTFKRNNVHGFMVLQQSQGPDDTAHVQLIAWGGQSLRGVDLNFGPSASGERQAILQATSAEYLAPDWILTGCTSAPEDVREKAFVVTAHNAILGVHITDHESSKYAKKIHVRQLVTGVKSILYAADILALSPSHVLITAGTAFGEIIVWSCFLNEDNWLAQGAGSIHHFFTGHEGSIFGVRISPLITSLPGRPTGRLLASCSDDRMVKLWDISNCEQTTRHDHSPYSTDGFELRSTGFGDLPAHESSLVSCFAHNARIWSVHFLPQMTGEQCEMNLVSCGEDATSVVWALRWELSPSQDTVYKLNELASIHNHAGKHIWSTDLQTSGTVTTVYSGGSDGALKTFQIVAAENGAAILPNKNNVISTTVDLQDSKIRTENNMKAFAFVTADCFIGTTTRGQVQLGWIGSHGTSAEQHILQETLTTEEDLRSFAIIATLPQSELALLSNARGLIRLYTHKNKTLRSLTDIGQRPQRLYILNHNRDVAGSSETLTFIATYVSGEKADLITATLMDSGETHLDKTTLVLPPHFEVSGASLVRDKQYLVLGAWQGKIASYRVTSSETPLTFIFNRTIHTREVVNQVISFESLYGDACTPSGYFLTCSRGGDYRVHELQVADESPDSVDVQTVHQTCPAIDIALEGAYVDKPSGDLMLYGFRGMDFILWNETKQCELARAWCGGPRRVWTFQPGRGDGTAGVFLWIQSSLKILQIQPDSQRTVRAGGHGREIQTMSVCQSTDEGTKLFATGSEDTNIRIFAPIDPQNRVLWGAFKCLRTLRKHDSGTQHVAWSRSGQFLFSSSGREELYVWQNRTLPMFGLATVSVAQAPKDDPKSDLRITSFDLLEVDGEAEGEFLLCLTYSNSQIKLFHYSSFGGFTLLSKGTYTSNCLTQAHFILRDSSLSLITASTDGHLTLWNLNPVIEPFYTVGSTLRLKQPIDATFIHAETIIACENRYQVHSNSIKTVELVEISSTASLVIAGGDDNALTLSLVRTNFTHTEGGASDAISTVTIPDAHAACISTTKVLAQRPSAHGDALHIVFASSGNDNRVKLWRAEVDARKTAADGGIQVQNLIDQYSAVEDISSVDVIREGSGETKLLVCGVGMELFGVPQRFFNTT